MTGLRRKAIDILQHYSHSEGIFNRICFTNTTVHSSYFFTDSFAIRAPEFCFIKYSGSYLLFRYNELSIVRRRDQIKREICKSNGITLIEIPYWWNQSIESVARTIKAVRPDVPLDASLLKGDIISQEIPISREGKGKRK